MTSMRHLASPAALALHHTTAARSASRAASAKSKGSQYMGKLLFGSIATMGTSSWSRAPPSDACGPAPMPSVEAMCPRYPATVAICCIWMQCQQSLRMIVGLTRAGAERRRAQGNIPDHVGHRHRSDRRRPQEQVWEQRSGRVFAWTGRDENEYVALEGTSSNQRWSQHVREPRGQDGAGA